MLNFVQRHRFLIKATMTSHEIEKIERQQNNIVYVYRAEASPRSSIDSSEDYTEYSKAWAGLNAVYPELE